MMETDATNTAPDTNSAPADPISPPETPAIRPDSDELERQMRPYHRWLVVLVVLTVGAACLLISAGHGTKEGMRPWTQGSLLRLLVELLNFNYAYPTPRGNDVKWLAQGVGAAAALVTAAVMWYMRTGRRRRDAENANGDPAASKASSGSRRPILEHLDLVTAAQIALVAFGVWSLWSYRWAHWPAAAMGEGLRNLIVIIGTVGLGRAMNRWSALRAGAGMAVVLAITAVVGIWYYHERNPVMRLEFPIGNPIFFAACMLPALALGLAGIGGGVESLIRRSRTAPSDAPDASAAPGRAPLVVLAASVLTLIVVGYAFALTDSRSPLVALAAGLAVGAAAMIVRRVSKERRRLVVLGFVVLALAAVVFVGKPWLDRQQSIQAGGRGASFRLRLYTWQYAKDMFLGVPIHLPNGQERKTSPLTGQGQGSYMALAQWLAMAPRDEWGRSDMEKDPAAFTSELVGHAHNEWLEILAELGAVGFALMATALGLTFWAAWRAFMRTDAPAEKWFVLALMVSLLAIVVEECADVALRMPVLPVIFYTVIGLLWAFSRERAPRTAEMSAAPGWLPPVGLAAAILGAMSMTSAVWRDWQGAVADGRVQQHLEKQQWDQAMLQASIAKRNRLVVESQISAGLHATEAAHAAAAQQFQRLQGMLARQEETSANRARIRSLAEGDIQLFDRCFGECIGNGMGMWQAVPGVHAAAEWMAHAFVMKHQIESLKPGIGMEPEQGPFLANARECVRMEYRRDRFDTPVALQLFAMSGDQPMDQRIELLRIPLRGGPEPSGSLAGIEATLRQILSTKNSFDAYLQVLLDRAEQSLTAANPDQWPDPYAPETFRLKALAESIAGRNEQAAAYAAKAVKLYGYETLRFYHPTALSHGLGEQAKYAFLAQPEQPAGAVEIVRRAIAAWPQGVQWDDYLYMLHRELSLYLLASGDEQAAVRVIRDQVESDTEESLKRNVGYGLAELCGLFMSRPPTERPAAFRNWISRSLELAPAGPNGRWIAARVSLEDGKTQEAIGHLETMRAGLDDPQQLMVTFQALASMFPSNEQLKAYMEKCVAELQGGLAGPAATQPAATRPAQGKPDTQVQE